MDLGLKGRRALVSGSSSGIGKAIALELAAEGCSVVVHGRDRARAEATAQQVRALGQDAFVALGDLADEADTARVVEEVRGFGGAIDILVNNSGGGVRRDSYGWSDIATEQWIAAFQANVGSTTRLCKAFVEPMQQRRWGRIVNISTLASIEVFAQLFDYAGVKACLNKFAADLSKIVGPYEITVNTIIPGIIKTPPMQQSLERTAKEQGWGDDPKENERLFAAKWSSSSVPRLGLPEDIAAAVAFLASPRAGYINGTLVRVDGGAASSVS